MLLSFSKRGSLPMRMMGERLQLHPTSITNIVDRLEADGLARRLPHPERPADDARRAHRRRPGPADGGDARP